jgi:2-dehydropantoate 2-reductase
MLLCVTFALCEDDPLPLSPPSFHPINSRIQPSANIQVSLICRSNYAAVASSGVTLETHSFGNYHFQPHTVYSSISNAATSPSAPQDGWDYIMVTTKTLPDVTDDSKDIEPLVRRAPDGKTCIVLIQNGVGIENAPRKRFPQNPIISAVTVVSAEQIRHGLVRQNRWTRISMGAYSDGHGGQTAEMQQLSKRGDDCARQLAGILTKYGKLRDAEVYDETGLQLIRWHKICINGAMNPSAVLSGGVGNADMVMDPELREHLKGCMDEVLTAIPAVLKTELPPNLAKPETILTSTARNKGAKPSMLIDWEAGRPMELEVILGNPIRIARAHGVEMPRLQTLYALLKSASKMREAEKKKECAH